MAVTRRRSRTEGLASSVPPPIEALVSVRLAADTGGERFLAYLRSEPAVVNAWWVAADVDAIVRLSCPTLAALDMAVSGLRLRGGAERTMTHLLLRQLDLTPTGAKP